MAKYSRELDEDLQKKVRDMANSMGLKAKGITVEPIRINKSKTYGEVIKSSDIVTLFTDDPNMVCIALNESLLINSKTGEHRFTPEYESYFIESLLTQVDYDDEKDKIVITKPEIHISAGIAEKYKGACLDMERAVVYAKQQIAEQKREEKEKEKADKASKKAERAAGIR